MAARRWPRSTGSTGATWFRLSKAWLSIRVDGGA